METKAIVVGAGKFGRNHIKDYLRMPGVHLIGVVDISEEARQVWEDAGAVVSIEQGVDYKITGNVPAYASIADIPIVPDIASVATPIESHFDVAMGLLKMGTHVLVEKPMTETVDQAKRLIAEAKRRNLVLAVGFIERFNGIVEPTRMALACLSGGQERPFGHMDHFGSLRTTTDKITIRALVRDLLIHDIDMGRFLFGDLKLSEYRYADDTVHIGLTTPGRHAYRCTAISASLAKRRAFTMWCNSCVIRGDYLSQTVECYGAKAFDWRHTFGRDQLYEQLSEFVAATQGKPAATLARGEDGLAAQEIVEQAIRMIGGE